MCPFCFLLLSKITIFFTICFECSFLFFLLFTTNLRFDNPLYLLTCSVQSGMQYLLPFQSWIKSNCYNFPYSSANPTFPNCLLCTLFASMRVQSCKLTDLSASRENQWHVFIYSTPRFLRTRFLRTSVLRTLFCRSLQKSYLKALSEPRFLRTRFLRTSVLRTFFFGPFRYLCM